MIFWILLSIAIAAIILAFIKGFREEYTRPYGDGFFASLGYGGALALLAALISGLVGGLILLACWAFIPGFHQEHTGTDHHELRALGTSNGIQGRLYYLGSGYINTTRVLSYITQDGAAVRVGSANGDASTVYEDGGQSVDVDHYVYVDPIVFPWQGTTSVQYTFHVPKGSVQDGYAVTAQQ